MTTALQRTSAPAALAVALDDVKENLRIDGDDSDAHLTALINVAIAHIDGTGTLGRAMITQSWAQWESNTPGVVKLLMGPVQSLTSVQYYDTGGVLQTATLSDYELRLSGDYHTVQPKTGFVWPTAQMRGDAIKITYVAGYGDAATDVPQDIRHALSMIVGHWFEHPEAVSGEKMEAVPMGVETILSNHRVAWYG